MLTSEKDEDEKIQCIDSYQPWACYDACSGTESRFPVARPQPKVQFKDARGSARGNHLQLTEAS